MTKARESTSTPAGIKRASDGEGREPFLEWLNRDYDEAALRRDFHANGLASFINDWVLAHE